MTAATTPAVLEQLRIRMENKNFSVNNLEKRAGLKRGVVNNILRGCSKNPTTGTLIAIADTLECSLDELVARNFKNNFFSHTLFELNHLDSSSANPWNLTLYLNVVTAIDEYLKKCNLLFSSQKIITLINEVYHYSSNKTNKPEGDENEVDRNFIAWIVTKI